MNRIHGRIFRHPGVPDLTVVALATADVCNRAELAPAASASLGKAATRGAMAVPMAATAAASS